MPRKNFSTYFLSLFFLLLPFMSYAENVGKAQTRSDQVRTITNSSSATWLILSRGLLPDAAVFKADPNDPKNMCEKGSDAGFCFLSAGKKTVVEYRDEGTLIFTYEGNPKSIYVFHRLTGDGVAMESTDDSKINDVHGNITIFPGANN